jgi:LPS-assembly protein
VVQLVFILLFFGSQQDQIETSANTQSRIPKPGSEGSFISHAEGNVVVTFRDIRLEADHVDYDDETNVVTAGDHITYTSADEHLKADHLSMAVDTKAGDFDNVSGQAGPGFFIKAEHAHRTEDGLYQLKNATITTCCDETRPGWMMTVARAVVDPHRRVTANGSVFRLEGVPVFYLPYVTVPSEDRERATGFLRPSTSTSTTKGRAVQESFYWAINRSTDATFTGEYFSKRGPAGAVNFRAVPDKTSRIQIESLFAHDKLGQGGRSARILAFGDLGRGYRGVADMNLLSSFVFRQVYEDGLNIISSPLVQSVGFLSKMYPDRDLNFLYSRNGVFFCSPTLGCANSQSTTVLKKFPSLEMGVGSRPLGGLPVYFSGESSISGMSRRDDQLTTPMYERFDLHPTIEFPLLKSDVLSWSHRLSMRETSYSQSLTAPAVLGGGLNKFSLDYSTHVGGPQFQRDFGSWRHLIEPTFDYRYIVGADHYQNTVVVDNIDLTTNTNEVEYGIVNRLFARREIFSWRISQKYFFDPTFGGAIVPGRRNVIAPLLDITGFAFADGVRRTSPVVSRMRVSSSPGTSTDVEVDYDTRDHLFRSAGIIGNASRGQFTGGVSYFFTRRSAIEIPNNQLRTSFSYGNRLKPGFSAALQFSYDVQHSLFQGSVAELGYNTNCFGLNFEVSQFNIGARVESRFRFSFTLKDVGSVGTLRPRERLF